MSILGLNTAIGGLIATDAKHVRGGFYIQDATPPLVAARLVADSVNVLNTVLDTPTDPDTLAEDVGDLIVTALCLLQMHGLSINAVVEVAASRLHETFEVDRPG